MTNRTRKTCRFCRAALTGQPAGDILDAGGTVGRAHVACFLAWDARQEGLEVALALRAGPDAGWEAA